MFDIQRTDSGMIQLEGRFHAAYADEASSVFETIAESCDVSFAALEYISSAGLSVLLHAQKRLNEDGHGLRLVAMRPAIRNVFVIAGFDAVFDIE